MAYRTERIWAVQEYKCELKCNSWLSWPLLVHTEYYWVCDSHIIYLSVWHRHCSHRPAFAADTAATSAGTSKSSWHLRTTSHHVHIATGYLPSGYQPYNIAHFIHQRRFAKNPSKHTPFTLPAHPCRAHHRRIRNPPQLRRHLSATPVHLILLWLPTTVPGPQPKAASAISFWTKIAEFQNLLFPCRSY